MKGVKMERNLTTGSVSKNIIYFSLPYLLSFFLQTLYGMADLFIVSQFNTTATITAVTIGSQVMHMITVMIVGLAMGTTVNIARAVGEGKQDKASRAIGNTITIFLVSSVVATLALVLLVKNIVSVMSTPSEAVDSTIKYLVVCFFGVPFITAYNVIASIFRGMGDSKTPMYFIGVACVANIGLDYLFIGVFGLGAMGAALGTTLAQTISVLVALLYIKLKNTTGISLSKADLKPDKSTTSAILKVGIPVSVQDGFIQIAFLIITIIANRRGLNDAAAVGIVEKIIGMLFLVPSTMLSTVSALAAQNFGAGKTKRAKQTLGYALLISVGYGVIIGVIVQFCAGNIIDIFENNGEVIHLGATYLQSYVWDVALAGMHFCFSGYFCAMEKSQISFIHNFLSIVLARVPLSYLFSKMFADTLFPMGAAAPIGSLLSVIICLIAYFILNKKKNEMKI